jgi:cytochrome c556
MQALGVEALRASDAQNAALLMEIGARMENVCESCHQAFWYPQDKHPAP